MKKITIEFDNIAMMRKFEGSLQFMGIEYSEPIEGQVLEITTISLEKNPYKIEISTTGNSIVIRSQQ